MTDVIDEAIDDLIAMGLVEVVDDGAEGEDQRVRLTAAGFEYADRIARGESDPG